MKDKLEMHRLRTTVQSFEISNKFLWEDRQVLVAEIERYRKEVERLQNLWYEACANQIFPPVQVQTIKMNVGDNK